MTIAILKVAVVGVPVLLLPETVYVTELEVWVGVPVICPVSALKDNPPGSEVGLIVKLSIRPINVGVNETGLLTTKLFGVV